MKKAIIAIVCMSAISFSCFTQLALADQFTEESLLKTVDEKHITPEYNSRGELGSDGLTDNQIYTFIDGDITIKHDEQVLLMIDGTFTSKATAIINNNVSLVPLRFVSENFGAKVDWIEAEQKIVIVYDDNKIEMKLNSTDVKINNTEVIFETPPFLFEGKTYVSIPFISEIYAKKAGYLLPVYRAIGNSLAYDPIVWIDSNTDTYSEDSAKTEMLDMLKGKLLNGLENYKKLNEDGRFAKEVENVSEQIKKDVENTKYIGQVGRYTLYYGPYTILVDTLTNEIYFYMPINAGATLYRVDFSSPNLFEVGYIAG